MAESKLLDGALDGTQVPHQPLCVITDHTTVSGLSIFKEVLRRSEQSGQDSLLVSVLYAPDTVLPSGSSSKSLDLTTVIPGFEDDAGTLAQLERRILDDYSALGDKGSIFIDALDVLAEDYSTSLAVRLFRSLLRRIRESKPPSRLVLLLPSQSPLLPSIIPPTITPTLTLLTPHPPELTTYLSKAYLTPIDSSPKFWQILETATSRRLADDLSFKADQGLDVAHPTNLVVQVLVRKATGGSKGISRSLEALVLASDRLQVGPVGEIVSVTPIAAVPTDTGAASASAAKTHADLDLPFNLNLTDQQKAARMGVPLPYAHEGEGAAVDLDFDDEDEEDDEEI